MRQRFNVTYDIVTPESAEHGDTAERGFIDADGRQIELPDDCCGEPAGKIKQECAMTLREALQHAGGFERSDDGFSYYEADGRMDYYSGAEERRALHLPGNVTAASVGRIARLLKNQ